MRQWGLCNLHKVSGFAVQKFVQHFPLTTSARYGIMVISAARQSCAARHYTTKSIFCQVKISKNQKKIVSAFTDTYPIKWVSAFMDTFLFYHSFLFVNTLWKVWALRPQSSFHFFVLLKAIG